MAVRDRNMFAWQAYVITMSFVSVGLLLGMFFLWRSYSDLNKKFESQAASLQTKTTEGAQALLRVDRLMEMLGKGDPESNEYMEQQASKFASDEVLGAVEKDYAQQMALFPNNVQAKDRNLLELPKTLLETIRLRNDQLAAFRKTLEQAQNDMTTKVADAEKARADAVVAQKKAETDLQTERQQHSEERARLNKEKNDAIAQFNRNIAEKDALITQAEGRIRDLTTLTNDQQETIEAQALEIAQLRNDDFAAPQGRIVRTYNGGTDVWINLGSEDGLRVGTPFSVIDESELNTSEAIPKAQLRITQLVPGNGHLARGKIDNYDYRRPVVTGDKVYSPAWRPGRVVGFALVGKMDMNGDSRDDAQQVMELIRTSGGKVDAVLDAKGNRDDSGGGMTPSTAYVVLGTDLSLNANGGADLLAEQQTRVENYKAFIAEAKQNGITQISLDKLLGYLKTEASDRTVPLGDRMRGQDFPAKPETRRPPSTGPVSGLYTNP